jgi:GNAT superfamily N-acetyltransferase
MEMVVVHPAYWGRGHGRNLVKWGMELARIDKVKQGVIAAKMGRDLYSNLGWKERAEICLEGDEITPQGVSVAVMEYDPTTD